MFYRVVFLKHLIELQVKIAGVLLPGFGSLNIRENHIPVANKTGDSIVQILLGTEIPVRHTEKSPWSNDIQQFLHSCEPDIIFSVCFPHSIPENIRTIAKSDSLNFHSSLLPKYRGPAPVFWQLYYGETNTGFSIHRLSDNIDAGDIVCQYPLSWPTGVTIDEIDKFLAFEGAKQFCILLQDFNPGTAASKVQDETSATYFPSPSDRDCIVPTTWSAQRAFNFLRGMACRRALSIRTTQGDIPVEQIVAVQRGEDRAFPPKRNEIDIEFDLRCFACSQTVI